MGDYDMKQVIVWNKSLKVRKGKFAAQCCHASRLAMLNAAGKSIVGPDNFGHPECLCYLFPTEQPTAQWLATKFTTIVVYVNSEKELLELQQQLVEYNRNGNVIHIPHALITDSGLTEFHGVQTITCLGVGPGPRDIIDMFTGHLELM